MFTTTHFGSMRRMTLVTWLGVTAACGHAAAQHTARGSSHPTQTQSHNTSHHTTPATPPHQTPHTPGPNSGNSGHPHPTEPPKPVAPHLPNNSLVGSKTNVVIIPVSVGGGRRVLATNSLLVVPPAREFVVVAPPTGNSLVVDPGLTGGTVTPTETALRITEMSRGTAARAGIQVGDVILSVDGKRTSVYSDLVAAVGGGRATVQVTYLNADENRVETKAVAVVDGKIGVVIEEVPIQSGN
jgi:PDZ domain